MDKKKILIALKKARTSIDKIIATIENEKGGNACFDVMQQNLSAIGLLKSANMLMLEKHLEENLSSLKTKKMSTRELTILKEEIVKIVNVAQKK